LNLRSLRSTGGGIDRKGLHQRVVNEARRRVELDTVRRIVADVAIRSAHVARYFGLSLLGRNQTWSRVH